MAITNLLLLFILAMMFGGIIPSRARSMTIACGSILVIFWLQPATPIRHLDYWFPTLSIALTIWVWSLTRAKPSSNNRVNLITSFLILGILIAIGITRYIPALCCLTPTPPPRILQIAIGLLPVIIFILISIRLDRNKRFFPILAIVLILILFIILKTEKLTLVASAMMRDWAGQSAELASVLDLPWLGFSYLAFRLLHVLRDHQAGKFPDYTLDEFISYGLFFPTFTAGPIDRVQRFVGNLRQPLPKKTELDQNLMGSARDKIFSISYENIAIGSQRVLIGIFKKFAIADSLALFALNPQNAVQTDSTLWMWVLLYAYALRIYFDFSGYTDIALGLGRLMGFNLPENFDRPYIKENLTNFWNSWHITLAQWFRAYFFNPFTRALRSNRQNLPTWSIILIGQLSTMVLIGLWHGVTWNFLIWGAWHGIGLFIHNRWSGWSRARSSRGFTNRASQILVQFSGWLLTFQYVALGWVWFALPTPEMAVQAFQTLFGI